MRNGKHRLQPLNFVSLISSILDITERDCHPPSYNHAKINNTGYQESKTRRKKEKKTKESKTVDPISTAEPSMNGNHTLGPTAVKSETGMGMNVGSIEGHPIANHKTGNPTS